jgi:hypothetical protein
MTAAWRVIGSQDKALAVIHANTRHRICDFPKYYHIFCQINGDQKLLNLVFILADIGLLLDGSVVNNTYHRAAFQIPLRPLLICLCRPRRALMPTPSCL